MGVLSITDADHPKGKYQFKFLNQREESIMLVTGFNPSSKRPYIQLTDLSCPKSNSNRTYIVPLNPGIVKATVTNATFIGNTIVLYVLEKWNDGKQTTTQYPRSVPWCP